MKPDSGPRGQTGRRRWDIMSPAKRSALMGRIRGHNTGPEIAVRRLLHGMGYRFRLHARDLPGRPDIVFRSRRVALFVHGCFWHRHNCGRAYKPKTRGVFWKRKFEGNVSRDRRTRKELEAAGWRVIVVWECELDDSTALADRLTKDLRAVAPRDRSSASASSPSAPEKTKMRTRDRVKASPPHGRHTRAS
jgi:DNA mismatch endonuclease (patch repair protein)